MTGQPRLTFDDTHPGWGPSPADPVRPVAAPRMWWAIRRVFRGYDIAQVDNLLCLAGIALATGSELQRVQARQALRSAELTKSVVGYAPRSVHGIFRQLSRELGAD